MERGIAVFSECPSAPTLASCVKLVETAERTGTKYMIAENYPFSAALLEMKRLREEGTLGRILYAEGEYNHTCPKEELAALTPGKYHWRAWLPRTYYVTHTLGPLMHVTGQTPVKVNAFAVHSEVQAQYEFRHNCDAFAMMNCITDGGALFRFTGCAAMASKLSSVTNFCPLVTTVTAESVVSSSHLKSGVESSESVLARSANASTSSLMSRPWRAILPISPRTFRSRSMASKPVWGRSWYSSDATLKFIASIV
jgi:hypothetical protein